MTSDKSAADVLRAQYPTRELLIAFITSVARPEAQLLQRAEVDEDSLYSAAADVLGALKLRLDKIEVADVGSLVYSKGGGIWVERLTGYGAFFAGCVEALGQSESLRMTIVGPTFLEPDWWHGRETRLPKFSSAVRNRVVGGTLAACELILRNNAPRYLANLQEFVRDEDEWNKLLDEMIGESYRVFGTNGEQGPRIRCFDPGYAFLPHLFDQSVLIGTRRSPLERVSGGWVLRARELIEIERERWDYLFEESSQSQKTALGELRAFLDDARVAYGSDSGQ